MTGPQAIGAAVAMVVAGFVASRWMARAPQRLSVENWAGRSVPAVLGIALYTGFVCGYPVALLVGPAEIWPRTLEFLGGFAAALMTLAGLVDDIYGGAARGFRGHLSEMGHLRFTTGSLKLIVGVSLAVVLALVIGGSGVRIAAAAILIAISTNLANALDIRPGRTLKVIIPVLAVVWTVSSGEPIGTLAAASLGAAVAILPFDLAERGMLGDAGSNPLGLLSGLGLAVVLPTWGVVAAAAVTLALQVAAETVTISRLIEAVPPLRWFDRLGRRN